MTSTEALRQLALADKHRSLGARFAPFAGWEMPIQYTGIVEEHRAVRERVGVFDVSHMGRLFVVGKDAGRLLRRAVTYKVDQLQEGEAHYALMCDDDGGILDDVFVYHLDAERYLLVNNAANADMGRERVASFVEPAMDVELQDRQSSTVMLAAQGPETFDFLAPLIGSDIEDLPKRYCLELPYLRDKLLVARTGYTGEDGFELITSSEAGGHLLDRLVFEGAVPCGLGARDTLRLEAALPLYGNDIDVSTSPFEAGLGFAVTLDDDADFSGQSALAGAKERGVTRRLACLRATDRGVMRHGYVVLHGDQAVGTVTSGGFSPMLNTSIGMAYLSADLERGTELDVDVRGKRLPVVVVRRPFYRAGKSADGA